MSEKLQLEAPIDVPKPQPGDAAKYQVMASAKLDPGTHTTDLVKFSGDSDVIRVEIDAAELIDHDLEIVVEASIDNGATFPFQGRGAREAGPGPTKDTQGNPIDGTKCGIEFGWRLHDPKDPSISKTAFKDCLVRATIIVNGKPLTAAVSMVRA